MKVVVRRRGSAPNRRDVAAAAGFVGGLAVGLIVWSRQTQRSRHNLFSRMPLKRMAALGYLRTQRSIRNVRLLRDYIQWEQNPRLKRTGEFVLRTMEASLDE